MDIRSFSKHDVVNCIRSSKKAAVDDNIRLIFSPIKINEGNFKQACELYGAIYGDQFETVIIIEDSEELLKKRLPMSSHEFYETPYGQVAVSDKYRNELCDEEDDLFIDDTGFHKEMSLFHQLMMLQCSIHDFSVVSIQISRDERPAIVKELAYVISELHELRNTLVIFCCDLASHEIDQFNRLQTNISNNDQSNLLNAVFSDESSLNGRGSFTCGILVAQNWGLEVEFIRGVEASAGESLVAGIAYKKKI